MAENNYIELNENQLEAISGGVNGPGNKHYEFYSWVDKYGVQGCLNQILYFVGNGHHYRARVVSSYEADDGCSQTVRMHKIHVLYDYDKREYKDHDETISGDDYTAYKRCHLK